MKDVEIKTVSDEESDIRLDRWFKRHYPALGFGQVAKLLRTGQVRVDGRRAKPGLRLRAGQEIRIPPLPAEAGAAPAQPERTALAPDDAEVARLRAAVLYRDDWVIALNKPAGLATQGGSRLTRHLDAMLDALRYESEDRPRLVHRLDKDTSGVLLLARTPAAAEHLTRAFRAQETRKLYWALTAGVPKPRSGRVDLPLAKAKRGGEEKMAHDPHGKRAVTAYRTITAMPGEGVAWLALSPLTGRTHQLRAHMAAVGTPIVGDGKYGARAAFPSALAAKRLHLHAREIAVPHPADGTTLRLRAPVPEHMTASFAALHFAPDDGEGIYPDGG